MSALQAERGRSLPPSLPPVGLSRAQAAAFIAVSPAFFDALVLDGRMPRPKRINTRVIWDRRKLEEAFDCLPTDGEEASNKSNSWDDVLPKFKH